MTTEQLIRADARKRGWQIIRRKEELGVVGVPCFVAPGTPGRCEIWVGTFEDSAALQSGLDWQLGNKHVANIRQLTNGKVLDRAGKPIGNELQSDGAMTCTISIMLDSGDYADAWQALKTYINAIHGGFRSDLAGLESSVNRPYTFPIHSERSREETIWLDLVKDERVAIVGLGGVGVWIADLMCKTDVSEIHAWDDDIIEEKNIIRMPGAVNPNDWLSQPKARWFENTYGQIHGKVIGHKQRITGENAKEMSQNITFGFIAVDNDNGRQLACEAFHESGVPFIDVGMSLQRDEAGIVAGSIRVVTARPYDDSWKLAIPKVDQTGQEIYGRLELPDFGATAAARAVLAWRKARGQVEPAQAPKCSVYHIARDDTTIRDAM